MNKIVTYILITVIIYATLCLHYRCRMPLLMPGEMKQQFYKIAENFDKVCKEHGIKYYIIAGTLLGAVRHTDMIPWDDDMDVGILEDQLDKFNKIDFEKYGMRAKGVNRNNIGKVFILGKYDSGHKMESVFIDVFVMENKNGRYHYTQEYSKKTWPREYFLEGELFPLKRYKFGSVFLNGPAEYLPYCERAWSKNWMVPKPKVDKIFFYPLDAIKLSKMKTKIQPVIKLEN